MDNLPGRHMPSRIPLGMLRGKPIAASMWNLSECFSTCRANYEGAVANAVRIRAWKHEASPERRLLKLRGADLR